MYYTYAIKSKSRKYIYVGLTRDSGKRLAYHNAGRLKTTKPYSPFVLLHQESFATRLEARIREKQLKPVLAKNS